MKHWLIKSEPAVYAWDQFVADQSTHWNGVRNYQAANNLKAMAKGDRVFFYHSNDGKNIVGIAEVTRTAYPDPEDEKNIFVMVDFKPVKAFKKPVTLAEIKTHDVLKQMALIRQSRLSVCPVSTEEWNIICKLGGV